MRTLLPEAGILGREINYIPQFTVGCNYLSQPEIPAIGNKFLIYGFVKKNVQCLIMYVMMKISLRTWYVHISGNIIFNLMPLTTISDLHSVVNRLMFVVANHYANDDSLTTQIMNPTPRLHTQNVHINHGMGLWPQNNGLWFSLFPGACIFDPTD